MTSVVSGILQFSAATVEWIPVKSEGQTIVEEEGQIPRPVDSMLKKPSEDEKINHRRGSSIASGRRYSGMGRTAGIHNPSKRGKRVNDHDDEDDEGATFAIPTSAILRFGFGSILDSSDQYYLSIYTNQVLKFFPFTEAEIKEILKAFSFITRQDFFRESEYIVRILNQRLAVARVQVLKELMKSPNPWITHTEDLYSCIYSLTEDRIPQKVYDMERLFHSCRLNKETVRETMGILKRMWIDTTSEKVHIKMLTIVERLIDRSKCICVYLCMHIRSALAALSSLPLIKYTGIMHASDDNFISICDWLDKIEKNLDPYLYSQR